MFEIHPFAKIVINAHEKDRSAHATNRRAHVGEIKAELPLLSSVATVIRFMQGLGMAVPVLSGRMAVGVVFGCLLWAMATSSPAQGLPQHMVTYMTGPGQTECPNNWTEAAYAQGRLILGTTAGSKVQILAGTPATDAQPPQHVHAFTVTGIVASGSNSSLPTSGVHIPRAAGGEVTSSGTSQEASLPLPFIQFLVCEQMAAESPDSAPYGTVAFFNASTCPNNWAALAQADGRFLLPAPAGVPLSYATSTVWDPANPPTHTHGLQASFGTQSADYEAFPSNWVEFANPGTYSVAGTTTGATGLPTTLAAAVDSGSFANLINMIQQQVSSLQASTAKLQALLQIQTSDPTKLFDLAAAGFLDAAAEVITFILDVIEDIAVALLNLIGGAITALQDALNADIDIPIISWLYKYVITGTIMDPGDDLTILDLLCLILAIPATILYKVLFGGASASPPFTSAQVSAITSSPIPWPSLSSIRTKAAPGTMTPTQEILLALGGITYFLYAFCDMGIDAYAAAE